MTFTTAPQTILVNVDVDTAPKLLTYLQSALSPSPHLAECAKLISEAKTFEFLMSLLQLTDQILLCSTAALAPTTGTTTAAVTPKDELISSERMIEKCYDAFISILFTIHNTTEFNQIIQLMVQKLTENTQDKATLRLRILVNVYNLLIVVENKFLVLKAILNYALVTKQTKLILHFHSSVQRWIQEWNLSSVDARELYLFLINITRAEKKDSLAFGYLLQYFETFSGDQFTPEATNLATETIISSLQSSISSYSERRALSRVLSKQTIQDPQLASLVNLLRVLVAGDLEGFNKFKSIPTNITLLTSHNISVDPLLHSLKLLILCNLATTTHVLSYENIAGALQISQDDVEEWIIEAISNNLIEASMDQINKVVVVR